MPPPRRPRRHQRSSAAETTSRANGNRGWLSVRRGGKFKREGGREHGDDALRLGDETLLLVFSALSDATDLVRCAATCRRWRRLVSSDTAFICRLGPPRCDRFIRRLALGFFYRSSFVPFLASSSSRHELSLGALTDGGVLGSSRVVASRNGRVVLDIRRTKSGCTLRLCVCDPMSGDVDFLPPLRGKESPGPYACTLLTAADGLHLYDSSDRRRTDCTRSSYRVLLVYNHRGYTALRCYSSDAGGSWGPEAEVTGARIGRKRQLGREAAHAALVRGGVVCWPGLGVALNLPTLKTSSPPFTVQGFYAPRRDGSNAVSNGTSVDRVLGVMPDGRLCVVESKNETIRCYVVGQADAVRDGGMSGRKELRWTMKLHGVVRLRWFCEKSGVVLFTAARNEPKTRVYAVDVETKQVGRMAGDEWPGDGDIDICGYEMDRVAMLAELAR